MARTHLSHARLMRIIDSYVRWDTVAEAADHSGVSRMTVGRIFNLIRKRLVASGVYESEESYLNFRYDVENEGDGEWFFEEEWKKAFNAAMGRYRGIDDENRRLYEAEAVFRLNNPHATPGEIKSYIMLGIRRAGPLNGDAPPDALYLLVFEEKLRRLIMEAGRGIALLERAMDAKRPIKPTELQSRPWLTGVPERVI